MSFCASARSLCAAGLLFVVGTGIASAQAYPNRPIRFIVPFPPGGITDVMVRALSVEIQKTVGQPFIVDNRAGANQIIGADACAKAAPDGYTVCLTGTDINSINPYLFKQLPYDPAKDLTGIAGLFLFTEGIIVSRELKVSSVGDLVNRGKRDPNALNYGSFGQGSALQLFMEWFKSKTGTAAVHVPYKGGAPLVQALMANEIQIVHFGLGNVMDHLKSNRLQLLAVSSPTRSPMFPSVPTLAESGIGAWPARNWFGVAAPANTPAAAVEKLNVEIRRVLAQPDFRDTRLAAFAFEGMDMGVREFAEFLARDRLNSGELVRLSGITPQ